VLGLVMKEGAVLVTAGTLIGLAFAWAGMRALWAGFFSVASVQGADPRLLVGAPIAAGRPGAGGVLCAGAAIDAHRSGGGAAAGVEGLTQRWRLWHNLARLAR
jgi:hypothetical protein